MRIQSAHIAGYGRLSNRTLKFNPGLQVIVGPNEQGKSTIRAFIGDMLYGQKRLTTMRAYEESQQLRAPWDDNVEYGGVLTYELDDGRVIEVNRVFDRSREAIHLFDRTHAREITGDFERLRNQEVDFATVHLGVTREVFLNVATISHLSLEGLGDKDALKRIREKILSLADSGEETSSAEAAMKRLQARIAEIGQPAARTRPLPAARQRRMQLETEYAQALALREELAGVTEQRRALAEEIGELHARRVQLEEEQRIIEAHDRARRLHEAETLIARIDTVTQHCLALDDAKDFPLDRTLEAQRAEHRAINAREQLARTCEEQRLLAQQIEEERRKTGEVPDTAFQDPPEALEERLETCAAALNRADMQIAAAQEALEEAKARLEETQGVLAGLPDFSRIAQDPVEWLTQLVSSFRMMLKSRDEECEARDRIREDVARRRAAIAADQELFRDWPRLPEQTREYELGKRLHEEQIEQRSNRLTTLEGVCEETADKQPGFLWMSVLCALGLAGVAAGFLFTGKMALLIPGGMLLLAIGCFLAMLLHGRMRLRQLGREIAEIRAELEAITKQEEGSHAIEELMRRAGCDTVRELEARFDQFRTASAELARRLEVLEEKESAAAETEALAPRMLERLRETFERVGETLRDEEDVQRGLSGAIARYQEYRDLKRRISELRAQIDRHAAELKRLDEARQTAEAEWRAVEEEVRAYLRENAFDEEADYESAAAALRACRTRAANLREARGRIEVLEEKARDLERRRVAEERDAATAAGELETLLAEGGVDSVEAWNETARRAKEYREVWNKRSALEEQLRVVLNNQDIDALREAVQADGELPEAPRRSRDQIKAEMTAVAQAIDAKMKEEHALHIRMTERSAGLRSLNEIEEERAELDRRIQDLELEYEAAVHALALIENVAGDKYVRIAPVLAARASAFLERITGGAYRELMVSRDLTLSVRIPQINRINENPERVLSKGTVDQVYLAIRLAFVQCISETGETLPMILDDPFANYDDARLARALELLAEIAATHQVLLFTCRDDVARAAAAVHAPIINL